jgi:WS/DGAT/MGAT family acyltransferase
MSDAEAIMWAVERDPALRSDICNLTILESEPSPDRLLATLGRALEQIPRLRQRVVDVPLRLAAPEFTEDPDLDPADHLRFVELPAPGDERQLLELVAQITSEPFDRSRPLWEFTLVTGLVDGRAALLQKVHHTITDGVGALRLSLSLVDFDADETSTPPSGEDDDTALTTPPRANRFDSARAAAVDSAARNIGAVRRITAGASRVLIHPTEVPARAGDVARMVASLQRQAFVTERARSDVTTERSLARHLETVRLPLAPMHAAAAALGGTINDAYVTALASALGRYHTRFGSEVAELRLAMPVSTREHGDSAANRFVPARVLVPIQPCDDITALFAVVRERMAAVKAEAAFSVAEGLAGVVSALPTPLLVAMTRSQARSTDFAASNLRGSPVPLYLAGSRIMSSFPFGPRTGTALNVTMFSYCDDLYLGVNLDPAAITDTDAFMRDLATSFERVLEFADEDLI